MTNTQVINNLWQELRQAINKTYQDRPDPENNNDADCLRDYAENISWSDDLAALLGRETANERQHRSNRLSVPGFSAQTAAKLILMDNALRGAEMTEMPKATAFLVLRQTAVEAEVIGFLIKGNLWPAWRKTVKSYDYADLMKAGQCA